MSYFISNQVPSYVTSANNETSTNIQPSPIISKFDNTETLVILPNCDADTRCAYWLGALNGINYIGCGINVLRFMSEIDETNANIGLQQAIDTRLGTPFSIIGDWFIKKLYNSGKDEYNNVNYKIFETKIDINSKNNLSYYFDVLNSYLPVNSCTIVKLNRNNYELLNRTPGHYVLMSKDMAGDLWTYEPLTSYTGHCDKRKYNGTVSDNFFKVYQNEGYDNVSLLMMKATIMGGGKNESKNNFLMPEDTIGDFIKDIQKSIECNKKQKGGKEIKKKE